MQDPIAVADRAHRTRRADLRFMLSHPAHLIALGFGSGLAPWAPGTFGTLWAWLVFVAVPAAVRRRHPRPGAAGLRGDRLVGRRPSPRATSDLADPSAIVWDEVVSFWLILWLITPAGWLAQLVAFALFRSSMPPSRDRSAGPIAASRRAAACRSAGRRVSASCSTTWSPPPARCSSSPPGAGGSARRPIRPDPEPPMLERFEPAAVLLADRLRARRQTPGHGRVVHRRADRRRLHRTARIERLVRLRLRHLFLPRQEPLDRRRRGRCSRNTVRSARRWRSRWPKARSRTRRPTGRSPSPASPVRAARCPASRSARSGSRLPGAAAPARRACCHFDGDRTPDPGPDRARRARCAVRRARRRPRRRPR